MSKKEVSQLNKQLVSGIKNMVDEKTAIGKVGKKIQSKSLGLCKEDKKSECISSTQ